MSKRKLLLADDSTTIQKVVNLTFADEGIDVLTAGDGDTAMRMLGEVRPDIILADVHMPGSNGYQICESIRSNPETKDMPVVLLVGSFEPFDENEARRVGASAFMTKPFQSIRQLVSQVTALLGDEADKADSFATAEEMPEPDVRAVPETVDIEDLYKASVGETVEVPAAEAEAPTYIDAGMDDEMIETSYAGDIAPESGRVLDFQEDPSPVMHHFDEIEVPSNDRDEIETARTSDLTAAEVSVDTFADTERFPQDFQEHGHTYRPDAEDTQNFEFDEIDLLEIPPADSEKTIEFTTEDAALESGSRQQVVSLSPELIEIIVQRVVEKLSEKY